MITSQPTGGIVVYEADNGELVWKQPSDFTRKVAVGNFLSGAPSPQIVFGSAAPGSRLPRIQ